MTDYYYGDVYHDGDPDGDGYYGDPLHSDAIPIEYDIDTFIRVYIYPVFLFCGTLGNITAMLMLRRYSQNVWSTCLYGSVLLAINLLKLYTECGNDWYEAVTTDRINISSEIIMVSNAVCKVYVFFISFVNHLSAWLVVAISVEVALTLCIPNYMYQMCTRERVQSVMLLITVLLISLNLHFFWTYGLTIYLEDLNISQQYCTYINELSNDFRDIVWPILDFLIRDLVPMVVVLVCSIISTVKMARKKNRGQELKNLLGKYFMDLGTLCELQYALVIVCWLFALSSFYNVLIAMNFMLKDELFKGMTNPQMIIFQAIFVVYNYAYLSLWFLVFFCTCRRWRKAIKSSFLKLFTRKYRVFKTEAEDNAALSKENTTQGVNSDCRKGPVIFKGTGSGFSTNV